MMAIDDIVPPLFTAQYSTQPRSLNNQERIPFVERNPQVQEAMRITD
jgi:hypothetical protein